PSTDAQARIVLDLPVVARGGDRFVLRGGPALTTIGGGLVNDPAPAGGRRARPWPTAATTPARRFAMLVEHAGTRGLVEAELPVKLGASPSGCERILREAAPSIARVNGRVYAARTLRELAERMNAIVRAHHAKHPLEPGAPLQSVREQIGASAE